MMALIYIIKFIALAAIILIRAALWFATVPLERLTALARWCRAR